MPKRLAFRHTAIYTGFRLGAGGFLPFMRTGAGRKKKAYQQHEQNYLSPTSTYTLSGYHSKQVKKLTENRIRDLREDSDLTQQQVADAIGITQRKYSYIETGQQQLTDDILIKLANFYNVSIDYLLRQTANPKRNL